MVVGAPLIRLAYGPNWDVAIPYFQILCFSGLLYTTNTMNNQVIKALGKSNVYFYTQLAKRTIGIVLIIIGALIGIWGLLCAVAINSFVFFFISASINKRLLGYGVNDQLKDVGGNLILSIVIGVIVYLFGMFLPINQYVLLVIQIVLYGALFLFISKWFNLPGYRTYYSIIMNRFSLKK